MTASITFIAPTLDTATGQVRDVTIEIAPSGLLVRLSAGRPRREDGPHHAVADFTEQATEIARAIVDATEEAEHRHERGGRP